MESTADRPATCVANSPTIPRCGCALKASTTLSTNPVRSLYDRRKLFHCSTIRCGPGAIIAGLTTAHRADRHPRPTPDPVDPAAAVACPGCWQSARRHHRRPWRAGLFLRLTVALAARERREQQRVVAPILPEARQSFSALGVAPRGFWASLYSDASPDQFH